MTKASTAPSDDVFLWGARRQRSITGGGSSDRSTSVGSSDCEWVLVESPDSSATRQHGNTMATSVVLPFIVLDSALRVCFSDPSDKERKLRADRLKTNEDGSIVAVAMIANVSGAELEVEVAVDELLTDVRVARDDDARAVRLVGARIKAGKVTSVIPDVGGDAFCEVSAPLSHDVKLLPLQDVVCELRELEVRRHNMELERYQRAFNASIMSGQRRRYLSVVQG